MSRIALIQLVVFCIWSAAIYSAHSGELLIVRGDGQYAPYEFTQNDELVGFHIDLIQKVAEQANIEITFKSYPWKRSLHMFKIGEADAITYLGKNPEREEFTYYLEDNILSYVHNSFVVPKYSKIKYEGNLENLIGYEIGVVRGFMYGDAFANADYLTTHEVNRREHMVAMINRGRLDAGLLNPLKLRNKFTETDQLEGLKVLEPPLRGIANYLGFSKSRKREEIGTLFSKHMAEFKKTSEFKTLLKEYGLEQL